MSAPPTPRCCPAGGTVPPRPPLFAGDHPAPPRHPALHFLDERAAHAAVLPRRVHDDPVEVEGAGGARRGTPADPADQASVDLRARGLVIGIGIPADADRRVEDLERHRDFVGAKECGRTGHFLHAGAIAGDERPGAGGDGGAAHAGTFWVSASAARACPNRWSASSTTLRMRSPYSQPRARPIRARPASLDRSGLGFTSST